MGQVVGIFGRVLGEFDDHLAGLFDGFEVSVHRLQDGVVVSVDSAGDLAVSRCRDRCENTESEESEEGFFHNVRRILLA